MSTQPKPWDPQYPWLFWTVMTAAAAFLGWAALPASGQITVPNTFVNGTAADAPQVNANFNALASNALNRTGGTMTGTLTTRDVTPSADATYALGSASFRFTNLFLSGSLNFAGTAGGVPYFNTATTTASSAALAANALVVGGGAGAAPATNANFTINAENVLSSATQFRAFGYNSTTQSIANATDTALTFNTETYDVGAVHDTASNTSRFTVPTGGDGLYAIAATYVPAAASGDARCFLRKNGTTALEGTARRFLLNASFQTPFPTSTMVTLVATDYVEIIAYQSSGGALNTGDAAATEFRNSMSVVKVW